MTPSIIYAIEEPETSQHTANQKILIKSLSELADSENTQIIITTHSANIVKQLDFNQLRLITSGYISNVSVKDLPYPSLNEVNYIAFSETSEEYHNELYGFIESTGQLSSYRHGKSTMPYTKIKRDGTTENELIILTEYIRHQIHHPENTHNLRYTDAQLHESVRLMRMFIESLRT